MLCLFVCLNGPKMVKNDPNIIQQWTKNDFKMDQNGPKWSKNYPKIVHRWSKVVEMVQKWSKRVQKW